MLTLNMEAVLHHYTEQNNEGLLPGFSIGELCIHGPGVAMGYWENERATRETFGTTMPGVRGNDWLRTGDRVSLRIACDECTFHLLTSRGVHRRPRWLLVVC